MEKYNYFESICEDIRQWLDWHDGQVDFNECREDIETYLLDSLYDDDSVTGNGSGSYYCNSWAAEESLRHNLDLLAEAADEFGYSNIIEQGAEVCDVIVRCYLLPRAVAHVLDELLDDCDRIAY